MLCPIYKVALIRELDGAVSAFELPPGAGAPASQQPDKSPPIKPAQPPKQPTGPPPPAYGGKSGASPARDIPVSVAVPGQIRAPPGKKKEDPDVWEPPETPPAAEQRPARGRRSERDEGDGGRRGGNAMPAWARDEAKRAGNLQREADNHVSASERRKKKSSVKPAVPKQSNASESDKRKKRMEYDDPMGAVGPKYKATHTDYRGSNAIVTAHRCCETPLLHSCAILSHYPQPSYEAGLVPSVPPPRRSSMPHLSRVPFLVGRSN